MRVRRSIPTTRPGKQANSTEERGAVTDAQVDEWIAFMRENGVKHVLSFLGDDEVEWYASVSDFARYRRSRRF